MAHARELEKHTPGVLDITVFCGFAYADVPDCGMSVAVVTEGDLALARAANAGLYFIRTSIRPDWDYGLSPGGLGHAPPAIR